MSYSSKLVIVTRRSSPHRKEHGSSNGGFCGCGYSDAYRSGQATEYRVIESKQSGSGNVVVVHHYRPPPESLEQRQSDYYQRRSRVESLKLRSALETDGEGNLNTIQVTIESRPWALWADNNDDYGTVEFTDQMDKTLHDTMIEGQTTKTLRVQHITPEILSALSRTEKVRLLRCLSAGAKKIYLNTWVNGKGKILANEIDQATIMILSLALRYRDRDNLLGELIGLSTPKTIISLKDYASTPPLMHPGMITSLAHATARNLTQCRKGNDYQHGSRSLLQHIPDLIASIITQMDLDVDLNSTQLGETFQELAHNWPKTEDQNVAGSSDDDRHEGQDRGYQVGLVLAGIRHSLHTNIVRKKKKLDYIKLFVRVALKALAATPVGGRAFTAFEPIADFTNEKKLAKVKEVAREAWKKIYGYYLDNVETKIKRYGEYEDSWNKYKEALKEVLEVTEEDLAAELE